MKKLHWPYLAANQGKVTKTFFPMCRVLKNSHECATVVEDVTCKKCLKKMKKGK